MRYLSLAILPACAIGSMLCPTLAAADWHTPHFQRETHDQWTNVRYDDGVCQYHYSYNAEDGNAEVERWGDCSHIVVGPNGEPLRTAVVVPAYPVPAVR
jgi:hypothetical protein